MIKLYYNLSTYQFIGKVTGGETWVQGDDDSKTLAIYFGSGADVASFTNGLTSTTIYNQTCTVNVTRPDDSTASLSATAIVSGTDIYYKLIIDGWVCEQAGTIEIEPQLITATTTTAYGQATQVVAEGTSGSEETITTTQYNTLIANYNTLNSIKLNAVLKGYYKSSEFSLSGSKTTAEYVEAVYAALIVAEGDYAFDSVATIMNDSVTISDLPSGTSDCLLTLQTEDGTGTQAKRGFVVARGTVASDQIYYGVVNSDSDSGFTGWKRYLNDDDLTTLNAAITAIEEGTQDITYDNAISGLVAVTLKTAIDELDSEIDDIKDGTTIVAKATGDKDGNAIDTTYLKKAGGTMSGAIAMGTNKITGLADGVLDTDAINKKQLDDEVTTIEASLDLKADLVGGLVPSSQLPSYVDDVIEVATYAALPTTGESGKLYLVVADETTGGDPSTYRWTGSTYMLIHDQMSAAELKVLYESNADTNAFTDALKTKLTDQYTKAALDILLGDIDTELGDRYTKSEVDALLDSLKAIYGWESSALANDVASAATVNNSIWTGYDMVLLVATDGTNTYTEIARVADLIDGDTFTVGSGTFVVGTTTSTFTYVGFTLDVTGLKIEQQLAENIATVHTGNTLENVDLNVQADIDELDGKIEINSAAITAEETARKTKDAELEQRLDTAEETQRKLVEGSEVSTEEGTDVIALPTKVAPSSGLKVQLDGLSLQAEQLVTNDEFSDGTTGYIAGNSTISIVSNKLKVLANGETTTYNVRFDSNLPTLNINDKIYYATKVNINTLNVTNFNLRTAFGTGSISPIDEFLTVTSNGLYHYSSLRTVTATGKPQHYLIVNTSVNNLSTDYFELYYAYAFNISTLITNKQYSPLYDDTFDNLTDGQIKAQMDLWVSNGTLPNDNLQSVSGDVRLKATGKNLFDSEWELGALNSSGAEIVSTTYIRPLEYISVKASTDYKLWRTSGSGDIYVNYFDIDYNHISQSADVVSTYFTTPSNCQYIKFSMFGTLESVIQLEQGTTATDYEPYVDTELYLQGDCSLHSLPNGVKDTIEYRNGKFYHVQRVQEYELVAGDIVSYVTSEVNLDYVYITKNADFAYPSGGYVPDGYTYFDGFLGEKSYADNIDRIGYIITNASAIRWGLGVANGTYASLAEAQADLAGTKILYQLATPIETEIISSGQLLGFPKGHIYIDNAIVPDIDIYSTKIDITDTDKPITSLDKIVKITGSLQEELSVDDATIAGDGLSFTHTSLTSGDMVFFVYRYDNSDNVLGLTTLSYYSGLEDLRFPVTVLSQPASGRPDFDATNIGLLFPQNDTGEVVYLIAQMPHDRIPDSPIEPHVHCRLTGAGQPVMKIDYKWYNPEGEAIPATFTTYTMNANTATWSSGTISNMIYGESAIDGTGKNASSIMIMKLYRDDNVYSGDLLVDEFDIHYYKNV